jgi:hypothetical protein
MKKLTPVFTALLIVLLTAFKADNLPALFSDRLSRSQLVFTPPGGYTEIPVISNRQMHYEYALKNPAKNFEVRYAVMPLDSVFMQFEAMQKDKNSVNVNTIGPNKLYYGAFLATMANISGGTKPPKIDAFPTEAVKHDFNADWGAFGVCEVGVEFGKGYKYCMGVAIHKDNLADAYYFYLTNDATDFQTELVPIFYAMKFK